MGTYQWLKLVHVVAAIAAVGTNLTYFVWLRLIRERSERSAFVLEGIQRLDRWLANPAYVVLPVTGIIMVLVGDLGFSTFWIATAIGLYVAMGAFAGIFFSPALRRQTAVAAGADGDYAAAARRTTTTGIVTMLLIGAIVFLMVMKPG